MDYLYLNFILYQSQVDKDNLTIFLQINYFNERKRKRLLRANNRKHIQSLSKAIDKDLQLIKQQLSKTTYLQLQQENTQYRDRQDIEALLKLQQKIATLI